MTHKHINIIIILNISLTYILRSGFVKQSHFFSLGLPASSLTDFPTDRKWISLIFLTSLKKKPKQLKLKAELNPHPSSFCVPAEG